MLPVQRVGDLTALAGLAAEDAHLGSVGEGVGDAGAERGEVLGDGGRLEGAEGGVVGAVVDGEDSVGRQRGLRRLGLKGKRRGGQCGFFRGNGTEVGGWMAGIKNWVYTKAEKGIRKRRMEQRKKHGILTRNPEKLLRCWKRRRWFSPRERKSRGVLDCYTQWYRSWGC